ncbi:hypothetical protein JAAARDRAFT_72709 [Jaapia argillacea MUCL 33604]|uniref:Peptidase A1 domain-containing protein n=1 Tax=Jaapia argillacea MUCL 33604 TaxID=933084 RepID=A0A067PH82_9AGAM|nr:hypothetical protein JAAARDRAFT_72709 [Jaapia argillacea MUCL 33604]
MVTLPISRFYRTTNDIPSAIIHQQHANRGSQRLARMSGQPEPSINDLRGRLRARITALPPRLQQPFDRFGLLEDFIPPMTRNKHQDKTNYTVVKSHDTRPQGFSQKDLLASDANTYTPSNHPTYNNSLGLAISANDIGYIATVQIGTPPRDFNLLVDSGSSDLWVGAENCISESDGSPCAHQLLGSTSSSTFNDSSLVWSISYGTGHLTGHIIQDNIAIAGMKLISHRLTRELSEQHTNTIVDALQIAGLIKEAITSYKISRLDDGKNDGEITFGGMDPTKYDPQSLVTVANINTQGFWEAKIDAFVVEGRNLGFEGRTAIIDTGTTMIIGPANDVDALHNKIPGSKLDNSTSWIIPCTTTVNLSITIAGRQFQLDPRDLVFLPFGDVFLKNVYLSTNTATNQITMANTT